MREQNSLPPKLPDRVLNWFLKDDLLEEISGDLYEYYMELGDIPEWKKKLFYCYHLINFLRPFALKKLEGRQKLNNYGMFKNYFKVGFRNILKYKMFSFINVFGLAVAMSVCMLIILMLADQKSYDQFHENKERVYRILGTPYVGSVPYATVPVPLSDAIKDRYPIIEKSTSLRKGVGGDAIYKNQIADLKGYFADDSFFEVLSFPLISGNKNSALSLPNSVVISKDKANQLFKDENPVGRHIQFEDRGLRVLDIDGDADSSVDWGTFTITGIVDNDAIKSHLKFDILMSISTLNRLQEDSLIVDNSQKWDAYQSAFSYILLKDEVSRSELKDALKNLSERQYSDLEDLSEYSFSSQKLTDITPGIIVANEDSFRLPELPYFVLSMFASIIMIMACLNYVNLSVAKSLSRMKEIGVRKVNGATRKNLMFQFLLESILTALLALVISTFILFFLKEAFMNLWVNKYLNFDLNVTVSVYLVFTAFALLVGMIAGIYPALFISRRKPVNALKSQIEEKKGKWGIRKVLSVSQFVFSLLFIVTSIVIYNQFKFFTEFEYGFDSENIVNVHLHGNDHELISTEFSSVPGVKNISACEYIPATGVTNLISLVDKRNEDEVIEMLHQKVSETFIDNLGLSLVAGKGLTTSASDDELTIINESAVNKLGFENPEEAIGSIWKTRENSSLKIVGVVRDFRATLLISGDEIQPMLMTSDPENFNFLNVKVSGENPMRVVSELEERWKKLDSRHRFKYEFYQNELDNTNLVVFDVVSVIGYISFLSILIACLGLLGMAIYTTERKTKEVGIRKVLGAAEMNIVLILSKSFMKLLLISVLIAAPLSFVVNKLWLDNFPNRVDFGFGTVVIGSLLMLGLGLLTIGSQTIRAARQNPVESLKDE
ncbi:MAG: FtsX-like permease family protein [Cyclobacteriaceae bacterium]